MLVRRFSLIVNVSTGITFFARGKIRLKLVVVIPGWANQTFRGRAQLFEHSPRVASKKLAIASRYGSGSNSVLALRAKLAK
jgi:hypothetical protein